MSGQAPDTRADFSKRLDAEIARRGWTNEHTARLLDVPERQVRRWRKGEVQPGRKSRERVIDLLGLDQERAA